MNLNDPFQKALAGFVLMALGIILFTWAARQTREEKGKFNIYTFNVYFASVAMILAGLFFVYSGVNGLL